MINRLKKKFLSEKIKFRKDLIDNNKIFFTLRWFFEAFARYTSKQSFDINLNFFRLLISIIISLPRSIFVRLIKYLDFLFPPSFGAIHTQINRYIIDSDISLMVSTSNSDIDIRSLIWKKEALSILKDFVNKHNIKDIKFIEIGAANGLVSLMLAAWSKKKSIKFKCVCVEPNFSNIEFLHKMIIKNKFDIKIVPCVINQYERWSKFEDIGNKGLVMDAINNKDNIIYKFSVTINEIMSSVFKPNIIYLDVLKNESQILDQLIKYCDNNTYILVELDSGISENLKQNLFDNNFELNHVQNDHFIISKK
ncbi:hypothetical protein N9B95_03080 [Candidatus Pelagibacter sp.]|nr:hypothetical protein [Candidatus Pelagibacter sp.]